MDIDLIKIGFAVLAGALGFLGGLLAFINGRLNEAKTDEEKDSVKLKTTYYIAQGLWFLGCLLCIAKGLQLFSVPLFIIAFAIQCRMFILDTSELSRLAILNIALLAATTAGAIVLTVCLYFVDRIVGIQGRTIDIISRSIPPPPPATPQK